MKTTIYDKTSKGRDEIATRAHKLAPRLRTLLLLVDGRRPEDELLRNVLGLGLTASALAELVEQEFIVLSRSFDVLPEVVVAPVLVAPEPVAPVAVPEPVRAPAPVMAPFMLTPAMKPAAAERPAVLPQEEVSQAEPTERLSDAQLFQQVYNFYNLTIKSNIGLRGFALQLRVEKAINLEELLELRQPYLDAILKAKGHIIATSLSDQLNDLLTSIPAQSRPQPAASASVSASAADDKAGENWNAGPSYFML
ncbi:hypothetical protein HSX11_25230 [Oxalobacteraceae bacterium]|nr:hypothetical protein [Oxalobacteraceae bacterium]